MADFFNEGLYKYVMMPIDEEPFKIDLNTRTIEVPQSFSKCASVQSDQLAETIIFIVDRYFDYMDLANTEIFVQWTLPENKKTGFAGNCFPTTVETGSEARVWHLLTGKKARSWTAGCRKEMARI